MRRVLRRDSAAGARVLAGLGPGLAIPDSATLRPVSEDYAVEEPGFRDRISKRGEEALGELAESLLENPVFNSAIQTALGAREKAQQAQQVAMGALNIPSASDLERLTRRVRAVSQRLEGVEDGIDRLEERLDGFGGAAGGHRVPAEVKERLDAIEARLEELTREVATLREGLAEDEAVSRDQASLGVTES
jgi:chromosome segregation ATPase